MSKYFNRLLRSLLRCHLLLVGFRIPSSGFRIPEPKFPDCLTTDDTNFAASLAAEISVPSKNLAEITAIMARSHRNFYKGKNRTDHAHCMLIYHYSNLCNGTLLAHFQYNSYADNYNICSYFAHARRVD